MPTSGNSGPDRASPGQSQFFLSVPSLTTRRGTLRCCSFPTRYRVAIPSLTAALVGFTGPTRVRHHRQATTGSQFVTAPKFGSGPSDSGLLQTPCHYRLPHLNELTRTGQTFTDENCDLPVARAATPTRGGIRSPSRCAGRSASISNAFQRTMICPFAPYWD